MRRPRLLKRFDPISIDQWAQMFSYGGLMYQLTGGSYSLESKQERPDASFSGYVSQLYKSSPVVFSCMNVRSKHFSEARYKFRRVKDGRPGDLFGTQELKRLEVPWLNGTTRDLNARAIQDADIAGNFYARRVPNGVARMRPDWVSIILGSKLDEDHPEWQIDAEILGYLYWPGGPGRGYDPIPLLVEEVCHWAPIPDPEARFRGMSWLTPIINEVLGDKAAAEHKLKYFENGAGPKLVVKLDPSIQLEAFNRWVEKFKEGQEGVANAYKTLFLGGGADASVVGANLQQNDFKVTVGSGETRIAAAAGTPPVLVGLSEGLQGSSLNAGNYSSARRRFADGELRPLWGSFAGALASIIITPGGAELWYDDRNIAALREDAGDLADIRQKDAVTMKTLVDAGYTPESAVAAVNADDMGLLVHSGLVSVQLQPPGTSKTPPTNGSVPAQLVAQP